jgi:hypothetical protein
MRRFFILLLPVMLLIALFGTFSQVATSYAHTAQPQRPHVTCSGAGCNGLDPEATGCANDAYTVKVKGGTVSFRTGRIELRYSPTCGTNWGRVTSTIGSAQLTVSIRRDDGLFYFAVGSGIQMWSPMVYAPNSKAKACGSVGNFGDCTEGI